jgi:hypothetical protein
MVGPSSLAQPLMTGVSVPIVPYICLSIVPLLSQPGSPPFGAGGGTFLCLPSQLALLVFLLMHEPALFPCPVTLIKETVPRMGHKPAMAAAVCGLGDTDSG